MLSMPSGWISTFDAISFYYHLIFKGHVPLAIIIGIEKSVVIVLLVIVTFKTNE